MLPAPATPPPRYTAEPNGPAPPAQAVVPPPKKKKGETTDIKKAVVDKICEKYLEQFKKCVKKHDPKFLGSDTVDNWRRTTAENIMHLIEENKAPFENVACTPGQRKNNVAVR